MYSYNDKNQKIALIGCGYWGTIIAKTLIRLKFKNLDNIIQYILAWKANTEIPLSQIIFLTRIFKQQKYL